MAAQYQVVAECAHVTLNGPSGRYYTLLLKGAMVPADAPELQRLLDEGYVAKTGSSENGGVDAAGIPAGAYTANVPESLTSTPVQKTAEQRKADAAAAERFKADAEVAERRAAAKAKLPEGGAAPDGRASQAVWVEHLCAKGSRYEDVKDVDKDELVKLAKQQH